LSDWEEGAKKDRAPIILNHKSHNLAPTGVRGSDEDIKRLGALNFTRIGGAENLVRHAVTSKSERLKVNELISPRREVNAQPIVYFRFSAR